MELNKLLQIRNVFLAHVNDKLAASIAYKIMKYLKASDAEEEFFFKKTREIASEYGEKDENGNIIKTDNESAKIAPDKIEECKQQLDALGKTDVSEPDIKFTLDELSELKLTVKEAFALDDVIEQPGGKT